MREFAVAFGIVISLTAEVQANYIIPPTLHVSLHDFDKYREILEKPSVNRIREVFKELDNSMKGNEKFSTIAAFISIYTLKKGLEKQDLQKDFDLRKYASFFYTTIGVSLIDINDKLAKNYIEHGETAAKYIRGEIDKNDVIKKTEKIDAESKLIVEPIYKSGIMEKMTKAEQELMLAAIAMIFDIADASSKRLASE
jgi:hypothetical protein